jgi:hypothetical protein
VTPTLSILRTGIELAASHSAAEPAACSEQEDDMFIEIREHSADLPNTTEGFTPKWVSASRARK